MAVEAVGIYPNKEGQLIGKGLRIASADGTQNLQIRFATQSNTWLTANIWVTVDAVRKGGSESLNSYANIGNNGAVSIARSSFAAPTQDGGMYVYSMPLTNSAMSAVASLIGTLSYSGRSYDALRLFIEVRVVWGNSDGEWVKGTETAYITFVPSYTASAAKYTLKGLEITYSASNWSRPNDKYQTGDITSASKATVNSGVKGIAKSSTKLVIPKENLKRIPNTGETLAGTLTMRGSWQGDDSYLNTLSLAGLTVTNTTTLKTPTITAVEQNGGILVTVNQTGSGTSATAIDVIMVDGEYVQDRVTLSPGQSHLFDAVPAGVQTTWQAVGYVAGNDSYQPTAPVSATASAVSVAGVSIVPAEGNPVSIPYNAAVTRNARPDSEAVKLAGRSRPTVGFGEGGAVTWTVSGMILTGERSDLSSFISTDPDELADLPMRGLCVIRTQDGRRAQVYITNANVSRAMGGTGYRSVSVSAEEVM